jgi:subtilase family serine protease
VAGDADEQGGMLLAFSAGGGTADGTSASAPLWGGLMALADQYAHHDLGLVNPAIYRIGRSSSYHKAFHDITTGTNGYPAAPGWDLVTGWGTPKAQLLIPLLARFTNRST